MAIRFVSLILLAVQIVVLGACGDSSNPQGVSRNLDDSSSLAVKNSAPVTLPDFPDESVPGTASPYRQTSGAVSINGDGYVDAAGGGNYNDTDIPHALVIAPGGDDDLLAWSWYTLSDMDTERPIGIDVHISSAPLAPGGEDDLPLHYWIGLSNYTQYTWQWFGPYNQDQASIVINDAAQDLVDRYVSSNTAGNAFHLVVATAALEQYVSVENPDGLTAARIETISVATLDVNDPGYDATKPHYTTIETLAPPDGKGGSALDPAQYVELGWTHIYDPFDEDLEAIQYKLYRRGPMDETRYPIGSVNAPVAVYVDPTDSAPGIPELVPGATYTYWLRAYNPQGYTPSDQGEYTVPLLGPTAVNASDATYADKIVLTWSRAEGATGYKIYRDGQTETELIASVGDIGTYEDTGISDYDDHMYWIRSTNQYMPNGGHFSNPDVGRCGQYGDWAVHAVDATETVGDRPSMLIYNGVPCVAYRDYGSWDLKFARSLVAAPSASTDWQVHTVDSASDVEAAQCLCIIGGKLAISYRDQAQGALMYARALTETPVSTGDWQRHLIIGWDGYDHGYWSSMVELNGTPAITFSEYNGPTVDHNLVYARSMKAEPENSGDWAVHQIESVGNVGGIQTIAIVNSCPVIAYQHFDAELNADLWYARSLVSEPTSASNWELHAVDTASNAYLPTIAVINGMPVVAYTDGLSNTGSSGGPLKFARALTASPASNADWHIQTVDPNTARYSPAVVQLGTSPAIAYYDEGNTCLRFALALIPAPVGPGDWVVNLVDNSGDVGIFPSMVISAGAPYIAYQDVDNADLKFARPNQ